jgi:hypothetical protein
MPEHIEAVRMSLTDALSKLSDAGSTPRQTAVDGDEQVWLVTLSGSFDNYATSGYYATGEIAPTPEPSCGTAVAILRQPNTLLASDLSHEPC